MKLKELKKDWEKDIVTLLRANFDYFFDKDLKIYGKGEVELKCEVVASLIVSLSGKYISTLIESAIKEARKEERERIGRKMKAYAKKNAVYESTIVLFRRFVEEELKTI